MNLQCCQIDADGKAGRSCGLCLHDCPRKETSGNGMKISHLGGPSPSEVPSNSVRPMLRLWVSGCTGKQQGETAVWFRARRRMKSMQMKGLRDELVRVPGFTAKTAFVGRRFHPRP